VKLFHLRKPSPVGARGIEVSDLGIVDTVRENGGEEIGESRIDGEIVEREGNVERRCEGDEEVVEGGKR
jgi:hypothetical protein